ncbi:HNH endonuclease signature motif containing protein [Shimia abyssi]|uniref:5-methylcytosine-specific restriction protein A n=1 Tax=Shimia abyssi TaxID=1662395 RepID=A0A2P8FFJ2_9RHOB|nr:HNH endonuclease signature motif containing protein [Shimia abyssi]PSL20472.1 5-methylcytosine-specific restriction protein A [Shimia abyssi]
MTAFVEGHLYSRVRDIHEVFGGQRQGGISTPAGQPFVFIFTGKSGAQHGYQDGWRDDGVFLYTGEGQRGDMTFRAGNAAVRDHDHSGKELLMFEALGHGKPVKFVGRFACQSWDTFRGPDSEGKERECIQFHLVRAETALSSEVGTDAGTDTLEPLDVLRKRAFEASKPSQSKTWSNAPQSYRARSKAVRDYVLKRANGVCELTGRTAPFRTRSGEPYLEVHHVRRLSDDGPDDPRWCAAIDPTVHREIHFGVHGEALNEQLVEKLKLIEPR